MYKILSSYDPDGFFTDLPVQLMICKKLVECLIPVFFFGILPYFLPYCLRIRLQNFRTFVRQDLHIPRKDHFSYIFRFRSFFIKEQ